MTLTFASRTAEIATDDTANETAETRRAAAFANEKRVNAKLGKVQMWVGMAMFGLLMLELGGFMGVQMSFNYSL